MDLETRMRKYHGETCDGGYAVTPFHTTIDGQNGGGGWRNSWPPRQASKACSQGPFSVKMWLSSSCFEALKYVPKLFIIKLITKLFQSVSQSVASTKFVEQKLASFDLPSLISLRDIFSYVPCFFNLTS